MVTGHTFSIVSSLNVAHAEKYVANKQEVAGWIPSRFGIHLFNFFKTKLVVIQLLNILCFMNLAVQYYPSLSKMIIYKTFHNGQTNISSQFSNPIEPVKLNFVIVLSCNKRC